MKCVSCFAGIGGFDLGFERAGIETVAVVERDESCRKLLAAKFPKAVVLDDVCTAGRHNLPACDILVGGFPCQDLSVAGKRRGLAGKRSGLFYELTRICDELRPSFLVWENVPGLLSSNDGFDFLAVLTELDRIGYHGAWRLFDAQHFGVAQRRRRVFGVFSLLDAGAERCAEILSLAEGLRGHPSPSRKARERVTGTLTRSALDGSSPTGGDGREGLIVTGTLHGRLNSQKADHASGGFLIPDVAPTLSSEGSDRGTDGQRDALIPDICPAVVSKWAKGSGGPVGDECQNLVVQNVTAFSSKDHGADATDDLAPTLRACGHKDSHANGGGPVAIAFNARQDPDSWEERTGPLDTDGSTQAVAFSGRTRGDDGRGYDRPPQVTGDKVGTLDMVKPWNVADRQGGVRRLTPRECERLQGFPDGWTTGFSDSTRYKMLGNAVAVPCAEWIGRRIKK